MRSSSIHFRTRPRPYNRPPIAVGDRLMFAGEKQAYRVRGIAAGGRFVIATKPFNLRHTVLYTVVDFDEGRRGPDDHYGGHGYDESGDLAANVAEFDAGEYEVSARHDVPLELVAVNGQPVRCEPIVSAR